MASEHDNDEQFEKVLHQVHQLLALAEDPGSSTNEAAVAFARAQLLIDRYAIEDWQLHESERRSDPIVERRVNMRSNPINAFKARLSGIVAIANQCRSYSKSQKARNGRRMVIAVVFYGTESDCMRAEMLWTSMEVFRASHWRRAAKEYQESATAAFRDGFYTGFQDEIQERFNELHQSVESSTSGRDLILVRGQQLDKYEASLNLSGTLDLTNRYLSDAGLEAGKQYADRVALGLPEMSPYDSLPAPAGRSSR